MAPPTSRSSHRGVKTKSSKVKKPKGIYKSKPPPRWFLRFPEDMLTEYITTDYFPIPVEAIEENEKLSFLNLPNEIFRLIFDRLDILDRASLALACKPLAQKITLHSPLLWDIPLMLRLNNHLEDPLGELLKGRLSKGWIPGHLKYCRKCAKFVPRSKTYWRDSLEAEYGMKAGNLGQKYRKWLVEASTYMREVRPIVTQLEEECDQWKKPKPQTCPRCKLLS